MLLLICGILLWSLVHLSKSLAPGVRAGLSGRIGDNAYKGLFSLLIVFSLVLIVLGWRGSVPLPGYDPPQWGRIVAVALMVPALILFFASNLPTNLKRLLRHPQLTGVTMWAVAHLLSNGDRRSLVLFGGFALWCIAEIIFINRRDGAWTRPAAVPIINDLKPVAIGIGAFALLAWVHPYFAGVPLMIR